MKKTRPRGWHNIDNSSLRAKRSNPSIRKKEEWIASSLSLLAMTGNKKAPVVTGA
jgi:hypothetical protein